MQTPLCILQSPQERGRRWLALAFSLNVMSTVTKASVYSRTAEDTPDTPSLASIDRFLDAVWMERGLSPNTLSAYRADLTALDRWLQSHGSSSLTAKRADVLAFIAHRVEGGARPRSTARQLSSFRRYYRYLIRDGAIKEDPTAQIAMPKIGRSLPKSLTEEEVESLLGRRRSTIRSATATARCSKCCTPPGCACRSW